MVFVLKSEFPDFPIFPVNGGHDVAEDLLEIGDIVPLVATPLTGRFVVFSH